MIEIAILYRTRSIGSMEVKRILPYSKRRSVGPFVFESGKIAEVKVTNDAKFMIIGGDRLEKPRFMWWNFVSTSAELIEKAKKDWKTGNFEMIEGASRRKFHEAQTQYILNLNVRKSALLQSSV